jgi:activating signal cointegrator complex subunit 1
MSSRPTHFLSLPLGHHAALRTKVAQLQSVLRSSNAAGFDESILCDPRRLHLTLGVLRLRDEQDLASDAPTVNGALHLLHQTRTDILEILQGQQLRVTLQGLGNFSSDIAATNVLYTPPVAEPQLTAVCDTVFDRFRNRGFLARTDPYTLHCTLVNTAHRRPAKGRGSRSVPRRRQPFDATAAFACSEPELLFGSYSIDAIRLCRMGPPGRDGDYISDGGIRLAPKASDSS